MKRSLTAFPKLAGNHRVGGGLQAELLDPGGTKEQFPVPGRAESSKKPSD